MANTVLDRHSRLFTIAFVILFNGLVTWYRHELGITGILLLALALVTGYAIAGIRPHSPRNDLAFRIMYPIYWSTILTTLITIWFLIAESTKTALEAYLLASLNDRFGVTHIPEIGSHISDPIPFVCWGTAVVGVLLALALTMPRAQPPRTATSRLV